MLDLLLIYKIYKKVVQFIIGPIFVVEDCELFYWVQISKIWCTFCPSLDASLLKATSLKWWLVESKVHIIWQFSQSWWVLSNAHWSDCLIEFARSSQPISSFCNHQQFWNSQIWFVSDQFSFDFVLHAFWRFRPNESYVV